MRTLISLCLAVDNNVTATAKLIQSDKDLLILNYSNDNFPGLSLSGEWMLPWIRGTALPADTSIGTGTPRPCSKKPLFTGMERGKMKVGRQ